MEGLVANVVEMVQLYTHERVQKLQNFLKYYECIKGDASLRLSYIINKMSISLNDCAIKIVDDLRFKIMQNASL